MSIAALSLALVCLTANPPPGDDEPRVASREDLPKGPLEYSWSAVTSGAQWQPEVRKTVIIQWLVGSVFSPFGGHIWAPMLLHQVPNNPPRRAAIILGVVGTITPWLLGFALSTTATIVSAFAILAIAQPTGVTRVGLPTSNQLALGPILAAVGVLALQGVYLVYPVLALVQIAANWYLIPRAVADAYSDAYALKHTQGYQ